MIRLMARKEDYKYKKIRIFTKLYWFKFMAYKKKRELEKDGYETWFMKG